MADHGTPTYPPEFFVPKIDSFLTIDLPGERTRATVRRVIDDHTAIVELTTMPMAKSHQYRFHDIVAVRRTVNSVTAPGSPETWSVVEERRTLPQTMEMNNAPQAGLEPRSDQREHKGDGRRGPQKVTGGGGKSKQRKAAPKSSRRPGRTRGR